MEVEHIRDARAWRNNEFVAYETGMYDILLLLTSDLSRMMINHSKRFVSMID